MLQQLSSFLPFVPATVGAISLLFNIYQFLASRREKLALRALVQGDFNTYFHIARQCARIRQPNQTDKSRNEEAVRAVEVIRGCADAARLNLVSYAREHLRFVPFYEHPSAPGVAQPAEVRDGMAPELHRANLAAKGSSAPGVV